MELPFSLIPVALQTVKQVGYTLQCLWYKIMFIFHRTRKKTNFVILNDLIVFFLIYRLFKSTEEQSKVFQDAGIMGRARDIK